MTSENAGLQECWDPRIWEFRIGGRCILDSLCHGRLESLNIGIKMGEACVKIPASTDVGIGESQSGSENVVAQCWHGRIWQGWGLRKWQLGPLE